MLANRKLEPVITEEDEPSDEVKLQKLSTKHKEVISLMAQGLDRVTVGTITEFTPQYVSWIMRQDVAKEYLARIVAVAEAQLQAQFCKAVDVIGDTMANGTEDGKLKAAKIQMEATGRIGKLQQSAPPAAGTDRLSVLAERLVSLLKTNRERIVNGEVLSVAIEQEAAKPA